MKVQAAAFGIIANAEYAATVPDGDIDIICDMCTKSAKFGTEKGLPKNEISYKIACELLSISRHGKTFLKTRIADGESGKFDKLQKALTFCEAVGRKL
jgi:hypothetical protein